MNPEKTTGTIKTQRWNVQKINGGQKDNQIIINLKGDGNYRESTGYKNHQPGAPSVPTAIDKVKRANFITVLPI